MDSEPAEVKISEFESQSTTSHQPATKLYGKINNNDDEFSDDIEEFMITCRMQGDVRDNKEDKKRKYIEATKKLLEHDRQLQILETHTDAKTIPVGLQIHVRSTVSLSNELKKQWDATTHTCSENLLQIIATHHKDAIATHKELRNSLKTEFTENQLKIINKNVIDQHNADFASRQSKRKYQPKQLEENRPPKRPFYRNKGYQPRRKNSNSTNPSKNYQTHQLKPNW